MSGEVLAVMEDAPFAEGAFWLLAQSPIIHAACRTVEKAALLLRLAIESGFKYSGMKGIARDTGIVVVEMLMHSTERMYGRAGWWRREMRCSWTRPLWGLW
jgi:tRNA(Phe) wybutosine-synthesizing methylase Tyw3